ncbi:uncharacterized protein ATNIH1004_000274 [Aspergillus tanneri]|uniref:Uncharacterized protein n=1 Tax=Aspergillus tanneri TaxID=1220188 RepID=A0A5M9MW88_9EURO|nr:uncharacterized protein ATNIH1004_000274 [Aspergillus tanneri]KAA8651392.1 hypothetical protein ATNIH1004_000274 [Aspergillus tanneri]
MASNMATKANKVQKALVRSIKQRYPVTINDLTKTEMDMLIGALNVDNISHMGRPTAPDDGVKEAIKNLPAVLRRSAFIRMVPNDVICPAFLCEPHKGLNPYIINHISVLLKREVGGHLKFLDRYYDKLNECLRELLTGLHDIRQILWNTSFPINSLGAVTVHTDEDKCEACLLAQIIDTPMWLQNLRTTLLSRTRTKKSHRAPRLLRFVDGGICTHRRLTTEIFYVSGQVAYDLKAARKEAIKYFKKIEPNDNPDGDDNGAKRHTILVFWDRNNDAATSDFIPTEVDNFHETSLANPVECDSLIDEIIGTYAALPSEEDVDSASYHLLIEENDKLPPVNPLSIRKSGRQQFPALDTVTKPVKHEARKSKELPPRPSSATEEGKSRAQPSLDTKQKRVSASASVERGSRCIPSLQVDWKKIIHGLCPLQSISKGLKHTVPGNSGTAERIAIDYQQLLSPRVELAYSESDYEDDSDPAAGPGDTTWSLVCADAVALSKPKEANPREVTLHKRKQR